MDLFSYILLHEFIRLCAQVIFDFQNEQKKTVAEVHENEQHRKIFEIDNLIALHVIVVNLFLYICKHLQVKWENCDLMARRKFQSQNAIFIYYAENTLFLNCIRK